MIRRVLKPIIPAEIINKYRSIRVDLPEWLGLYLYKGSGVICPICNSRFRVFGDFGFYTRKNALCHKCRSLERHRLVWLYIMKRTNLLNSECKLKLLHVSPEKFKYDIFSEIGNIEYYPCDLVPENFSFGDREKIIKVDLTDIPFESEFFDVVLCTNVLSAIPDDARAISELYRVMKKNSWAILQDTVDFSRDTTYEDFSITDPGRREIAYGYKGCVRLYGKDFKSRLESPGFLVESNDFAKTFSDTESYRYGISKSQLTYVCEK